jgi:light-regulated signal transduction histidine kinase (bacteriophytochrome)
MTHATSDREVSEFLLRACHDLRGAARTVRTHSELFLKEADKRGDPAIGQRLGFIVDGSLKIDRLLDGMVHYSLALQTDPASFQSTRTDVLLRFVLQQLDKEVRSAGAEVIYADLPEVKGDPDRLMEVFENLVRNALVHRSDAPPRIEIGAARQPGEWVFSVKNNGPGVETDFLERIFLPFERLDRHGPGAGLGLTICRAIVERHGGRMWAESRPANGSTFYFTLAAGASD